MANHQIPQASERIEELICVTSEGRTARCRVYRHTRAGHSRPDFYVVQYLLTAKGRVDRDTRVTSQITGAHAQARLDAEMSEVRALFAQAQRESLT
jgi:hypothetical protein